MSQNATRPSARAEADLTSTSGTSPGSRRTDLDFSTLCAQAGRGRRDGEPLVPAIMQSTTYARAGLESSAEHCYSRASNPTVAALEGALARLEDAPHAVAFATGLAAETALFQAVCRGGDQIGRAHV